MKSVKRVIDGYPRMHIFPYTQHFQNSLAMSPSASIADHHLMASLSNHHRISNQVKMVSSVEKEGCAAAGADAGALEKPVSLDLPAPSDWSKEFFPENSCETLRRSSRIIEKAKAPLVEPESDPPKKRRKKSASKKKASEDKEQETEDVDKNEDEKDKKQYGRRGKAKWWVREWKLNKEE